MKPTTTLVKLILIISIAVGLPGYAVSGSCKKLKAKTIFETSEPILDIAIDSKENVYAVTLKGEILRISPEGKSQVLTTGLDTCGFSAQVLSVYDEGHLLVNNCLNKKDVLLKIDPAGNRSVLMTFDDSLRSLAVDNSGRIYLGFWKTKGDLSVNFQPFNYLGGAENMWGEISVLDKDGSLHEFYKGGIPMTLSTSETGLLYSVIWGKKGRFSPESKEYSVCGPKNRFWVTLSEQTLIQKHTSNNTVSIFTDALDSATYVATGKQGLFAFGSSKEKKCGIYKLGDKKISRLEFSDDMITDRLTDIELSANYLYFSDANGKIQRVNL